jgi:hypothetical protein
MSVLISPQSILINYCLLSFKAIYSIHKQDEYHLIGSYVSQLIWKRLDLKRYLEYFIRIKVAPLYRNLEQQMSTKLARLNL